MSHPNPTDKDELREKLAKIIDYVWQNDAPISIVPSVAVKDIMQLFGQYADQRVKKELAKLVKRQKKYIGTATFFDSPKSQGEKDEAERTLTWLEDVAALNQSAAKEQQEEDGDANT